MPNKPQHEGYYTRLKHGHIIGIIDSYGVVHSEFTGDTVRFHEEFWPGRTHCMWRWSNHRSIWWITAECKPTEEQYTDIQHHLTKKYGLEWWENGHHDLDHFTKMIENEAAQNI